MENINLKTVYQWPFRQQVYIFAVVSVLTILLGYWWDISSLELKLAGIKNQEKFLKDGVASVIAKEEATRADVSRLPATEKLLTQWKKKLVDASKIPKSLNEILKVGSNNHLYFGLFQPGIRNDEGIYPRIPLKVVVVGNYHQLSDFLSQLANLSWLLKIGQFSFSSINKPELLGQKLADQANMQNLITAELNLEIDIYREKTAHAN